MSGSDSPLKPQGTEPMLAQCREDYAYDGEECSPTYGPKEDHSFENTGSSCDRACNIIAVALLFMILITSIVSIAAGACELSSLSGKPFKHFSLFFAFGVTPIVIGAVCLILSVIAIIFVAMCAMGLGRYGMCWSNTNSSRRGLWVCLLGIFPFIVFLLLLAMCILGFNYYTLSRQLPPLDKNYINVDGISGPVDIVRDSNGLVHIRANSRRDAFFAQGFAEAQDRLFQLEFHRMVAQGKLSTLIGTDGLSTDTSIRTLNVRDAAYSMCENTPQHIIEFFGAFADGVNLYLKRVSKRPVEFYYMSTKPMYFHDPKPFSAIDICLTARLFQWQMSSNLDKEGMRFSVWAGTNRTYSELEELTPDFSNQPNTIMSLDQLTELIKNAGDYSDPVANARRLKMSAMVESALYDQVLGPVRALAQKLLGLLARFQDAIDLLGYEQVLKQAIEEFHGIDGLLALLTGGGGGAGGSPFAARSAATAAPVTPITTDPIKAASAAVAGLVGAASLRLPDNEAFTYKFLHASNAWATRDATGKAMAASDPHLSLNLPSVWYYVHLSYSTEDHTQYDVAGVGLVGIPGVHIGKNSNVAWGITFAMADLEDIFVIPPSLLTGLPPKTYWYGGKQLVYTHRRERIKVKGQKDIVLEVDDTVFGPVISSMLGIPSGILDLALYALPLRKDDDGSAIALMSMTDPTINTTEKLMGQLLQLQAPGFSIPIADTAGNIAYVMTGKIPVRGAGHTGKYPTMAFDIPGMLQALQALSPSAGGTPPDFKNILQLFPAIFKNLSNWTTYVSATPGVADQSIPNVLNPHVHIPYDGTPAYIAAANQAPVPNGYPFAIGADYAWPYRGSRIQEMLADSESAGTLSSPQTHHDIQMDVRSNIWVKDIQPIVQGTLFASGVAGDKSAEQWRDRLLQWNEFTPIGSVEAAFFWRWMQRLAELPRDAIKAFGKQHWGVNNRYIYAMWNAPTRRMLMECASYIGQAWNGTNPTAVPTDACTNFFVKTFKEQASKTDFNEKWGKDLNRLSGVHEMLSTKKISQVFEREMDKAGDTSSVGVSDHTMDGNMPSTQASSMRQLYNLWDPVEHNYVHFAFPGGNSGNPYSEYYDNMWYLYEQELYVKVPVTAASWVNITVAHKQTLGA